MKILASDFDNTIYYEDDSKRNQKNSMSDTEYAMNRETLEKAKLSLANNNQQ